MPNLVEWVKKWFEGASKKQKLIASGVVFSLLCTLALFGFGPDSASSKDPLGSPAMFFLSVFLKLIGVLVLIVASSMIFRRWLQYGMHGKSMRNLRLVETVRLSARQAIHLVTIGDQQFLIGATDQNVSLIAPVEVNLNPDPEVAVLPQPGLDFGALFQMVKSGSSPEPVKEKIEG